MKRWLVALMVVVAAACAPAPESSTDPPAAAATASAGGTVAALDFTADLVDGGQLAGGDLEGRDVVLWFWAPW